MANTINLGSYPTGDGTTDEEKSIYIGNNQFVRILSQNDPDRTIAVLSESTDVFSDTQTISNLHEQVIFNGEKITNYKLKELTNGDVLIVGSKSSRTGSYVNTAISLRFNDVSEAFEIISDFDISDDNAGIYNMSGYGFEMYDDDTMVLFGIHGGMFRSFIIKGVTAGNSSHIDLYSNGLADSYFREQSTFTTVIDDKVFFSIGSEDNYQGFLVDMTNENLVYGAEYYFNSVTKLDADRYVTIIVDPNGDLKYKLDTISFTNTDNSKFFTPIIDIGSPADDDRMCDILPLDRQHLVYFYRPENQGSIYAIFLKMIDENYGFVSDNSLDGNVTFGQGIHVCDITANDGIIGSYHSGRLINIISSNEFWIQTEYNEFTFITMNAS